MKALCAIPTGRSTHKTDIRSHLSNGKRLPQLRSVRAAGEPSNFLQRRTVKGEKLHESGRRLCVVAARISRAFGGNEKLKTSRISSARRGDLGEFEASLKCKQCEITTSLHDGAFEVRARASLRILWRLREDVKELLARAAGARRFHFETGLSGKLLKG